MNRTTATASYAINLLLFAALTAAAPAQAAGTLFRSYLSSTGNDSNPCSITAPCRLLPAALAKTQDGGEVWMLDSANYNTGTVTISYSVTILAVPGALGSLVSDQGDAIDIPAASISVTLRNLSLLGFEGSNHYGVLVAGSNARLIVEDSEFRKLGTGIGLNGAGGSQVTISRSLFLGDTNGIAVLGTADAAAQATVVRCTFVGPGIVDSSSYNSAIFALYSAVTVSRSTVTNFGYATISSSSSTIILNDDVISHNRWVGYIEGTSSITKVTGINTLFNNLTEMRNGALTAVANQ